MYYNTNNEEGETLAASHKQTIRQEDIILEIFRANKTESYSPHQLNNIMHKEYNQLVPLTSVRRAITNLTNDGFLIKTDDMVMGTFGKKVHTWKLANENNLLH